MKVLRALGESSTFLRREFYALSGKVLRAAVADIAHAVPDRYGADLLAARPIGVNSARSAKSAQASQNQRAPYSGTLTGASPKTTMPSTDQRMPLTKNGTDSPIFQYSKKWEIDSVVAVQRVGLITSGQRVHEVSHCARRAEAGERPILM